MNADLLKIRKSRLFKDLPDRAFDRVAARIKVRAFAKGDDALKLTSRGEFSKYFGYVVSGRMLFLGEQNRPLGLVNKDEFFLGRPFSLNGTTVTNLVSANDQTFVVFIPKEIISILSQASTQIHDIVEEIYEAVFERARLIAADKNAPEEVGDWLREFDSDKTLSGWIANIEKRQRDAQTKAQKEKAAEKWNQTLWWTGIGFTFLIAWECFARKYGWSFTFSRILLPNLGFQKFDPGSRFNIGLGIVGYTLIILTNFHSFSKWAIRKLKWKINYQLSIRIHIFFGVMGTIFILFHSAFFLKGINIAQIAFFAIVLSLVSGFIGQVISNQIPKTIHGEKMRLEALKSEQLKLQQKAEMLMDDSRLYHESQGIMGEEMSPNFWKFIFYKPIQWWARRKVKEKLQTRGLHDQMAQLAAHLIMKEYEMRQRIRFLEVANSLLRRWMLVHKPLGYIVYILGAIHIILVTLWA